jgi:hypothetical protein
MRSALRHFGLMLLGAVLLVPALLAQDKDKKDTTDQKEKLIKIRDIVGKVTGTDPNEKSFHLQLVGARQDVKVMTTDDVKVRTKNPPVAYDDKGNKKKYTAKELKELKGNDPKLPGYTAEFNDLKQNQVVEVSLVRKKSDRDAKQPLASVILIVTQPN